MDRAQGDNRAPVGAFPFSAIDSIFQKTSPRGDRMKIPGLILKQMYTLGSLENVEDGVRFSLKNRLSNATVTRLTEVRIDGRAVPLDRLSLELNGDRIAGTAITPTAAVAFPLAK